MGFLLGTPPRYLILLSVPLSTLLWLGLMPKPSSFPQGASLFFWKEFLPTISDISQESDHHWVLRSLPIMLMAFLHSVWTQSPKGSVQRLWIFLDTFPRSPLKGQSSAFGGEHFWDYLAPLWVYQVLVDLPFHHPPPLLLFLCSCPDAPAVSTLSTSTHLRGLLVFPRHLALVVMSSECFLLRYPIYSILVSGGVGIIKTSLWTCPAVAQIPCTHCSINLK